MGLLTIYQDNYADSTVISNRFIDEYMQAANDAQLKIYLYNPYDERAAQYQYL